MANSKCKKKQSKPLSSYERELKLKNTFDRKVRKLEKQVRNNPNDMIAAYNLAVFRKDGIKGKGWAG